MSKTFSRSLLAVSVAAAFQVPAFADTPAAAAAADSGEPAPSVVVVTASLRHQALATAPAFVSVVTEEDIAKAPVNSLPDLLRETVGVNNMTDSSGRDEIQIRGLGGKYTLMLVNGKRVSSSGALWRGGDFDFSSIPLSSIKRIEIVRGPMAALYGSDAMGGVVNIITKTPGREWKGTATAEYRDVGRGDGGRQTRVGVSANGAVNDALALSLGADFYDRDPWYTQPASNPNRTARLEEKKSRNFTGTATWKLSEAQSLDVDLGYNDDERPRALYYYAYYPEYNFESKDYHAQHIRRTTYGLTHKGNWDWGTSTVYLAREQGRIDDFNTRYGDPQARRVEEDNTYAKAYAGTTFGRHAVTAGVDLRRQTIDDPATYLQTGRVTTNSRAAFAEDDVTLLPSLHLNLAGRMDDSNTFGSHFSPKGYLVWSAAEGVVVKGGVSRAFKAPEAYQLSREYRTVSCGGSCFLSGNPDLKPETGTNYEAGVELHRAAWDVTAVLFKNDVHDMIVAIYDASVPERRWVNVARARTRGLELSGEWRLNPAWSLSANATRLVADYVDETGTRMKLDNRPEQTANVSVTWQALPRLSALLGAHYTGRQYYENAELPGYTRFDLGLASQLTRRLTVRAGVKNLTDVDLERKNRNFSFFELGRNYYVSAAYNF